MVGAVAAGVLLVAALLTLCGQSDNGPSKVAAKNGTTTSSSGDASTTVTALDGTSSSAAAGAAGTTTTRRATTTVRPGTTGAPGTAAGGPVGVKLTQVASLSEPLALAQAPNDNALYVAEKGGRVRAIRNGQVAGGSILDISGQISTGGEQGLLGLAFSPSRPTMVVNYTDKAGDTHVDEYPFSGGQVTGAARRLLFVDQPYANHNGGNVVFGPDGRLYVGMGDGGSGGDPQNHAQTAGDVLGKMLRIDTAQASPQAEIWMIGLRNPWRWSFDRATGDMWIGDVGQNAWEEVDVAPAGTSGQNWGWNRREGKHAYGSTAAAAGVVDPIYDYAHSGSVCAVTGGYVYRGSKLGGWGGTYLFADYCVGKVMALARSGNSASVRDTGLSTSQLTSFGEDRTGEVYVLSQAGPVYRIDPK
jgi:glucose/arabinose dehydrogenase